MYRGVTMSGLKEGTTKRTCEKGSLTTIYASFGCLPIAEEWRLTVKLVILPCGFATTKGTYPSYQS